MQWRCRQEVEDALWAAARTHLPARALDRKRLLQAITQRTALYTTEREHLSASAHSQMPATDIAARTLFFGVADAAKIAIPLQELAGRNLLPTAATWKILDLGGGGGAMGLGILSFAADHHPGLSLEIDAVDLDEDALAIYQSALQVLCSDNQDFPQSEIRTHLASVTQFEIERGGYDLVIAGTLLNELPEPEAEALTIRAMAGVREKGALILIEPALRTTSRALHRVRDLLIEADATIFAPCTRSAAPCPALQDASDWCHEDRPVVLPSRARQLAASTGLRDGGLKFSYVVARHDTEKLVEGDAEELAWRVVSQPQRGKGQRECFACSEVGRKKVRLLKRNRNSGNRFFDRARRGDVLIGRLDAEIKSERVEISKEQRVKLCRPANLVDDG